MQLYIDGWKQHLCFSAAHFIPNHQQCSLLHGHTYVVSCQIDGTLNPITNMVLDFTELKNILRTLISTLDHHILIPKQHPGIHQETSTVHIKIGKKSYTIPKEDCVFLSLPSTTAEHLAIYLLNQLIQQLSPMSNIQRISIRIDEGLGQSATAEQQI